MRGPHVPGADATSISVQGLEMFRKKIGSLVRQASSPEDAAAARVVGMRLMIGAGAMRTHLASGDPERALQLAPGCARAANRDLMERLGYNAKTEDAKPGKLINKIVRGENDQFTGPVGVSNALTAGAIHPGRFIQG